MTHALAELDAPRAATALLDAAERLFAAHGIAEVSIRQIVRASGQGNLSAAHYHFGSRDALIRAVIERRLRTLDAIRHRRLDAIVAAGSAGDLGTLVESAVTALVEAVESTDWGADYVRVLAQALFDPRMRLLDTVDPAAMSSLARVRALARPLLPAVSDATFDARVTMVHHHAAHAVARWVHEHGRVGAANRGAYRAMARRVTDFLVGGFGAPDRETGGARPPLRAGRPR
jgi:AcrR family transcriptional regulator